MLFNDLILEGHDFEADVRDLVAPGAYLKNVTENDPDIDVICQGHNYDAIAVVFNKTSDELTIDFYDIEESIIIAPGDYNLLLANDDSRFMLLQFVHRNYLVYHTGGGED